ncbi:hypothetical protein HYPSUDRAFT_46780 [Hypholoma sublateritium FD-334 SS-4]|uniref:F-box domain-containing protein n=1 Tax=Hypholoma sublateritium (strain FD-334 SS-4) TaxID=945553 RepID=A0A0D2ND87_HYPSF|nr:hypothetical protein HYPSUDRAFT_46780 [Hypholoma sublateritium FD-334 SS-4]
MPPREGHIPLELIEEIIDGLSAETSLRTVRRSVLSNIALVSRSCRYRVNTQRFSQINIGIHQMDMAQIQTLARILASDMWQKDDGPAQHVRSMTLVLGTTDNRNLLSDPFKSQLIASILDVIFRHGDGTSVHTDINYTLSINTAIYAYSDPQHDGPAYGLPFTILDPAVVGALYRLCRSSLLNTLSLQTIWDVPSSIVLTSALTRLLLHRVHFTPSGSSNVLPFRNLKHLRVEMSPSLLDGVLGSTGEFPFSLETVRFKVNYAGGYEILRRLSKSIVHLILAIVHHSASDSRQSGIDSSVIEYSGFLKLRVLEICLSDFFRPVFADEDAILNNPEQQPIFLRIFNLLPTNTPPILLININIELNYDHPVMSSHSGLDQLYHRMYHPSLIRLLEHCSDHSQITLDIDLDVVLDPDFASPIRHTLKSLAEEYEEYFRGLLSCLVRIEGLSVLVHVSILRMQ